MAASEHDAATSEKHLDELARQGKLATTAPSESEEPKLNIRNTAVKTLLDQTVGATANTLLFLAFMTALQSAITRGAGAGATLSVDWSRVDWRTDITARCRRDFWPVMLAGWKFWPFISLVNFAFVKSVEARNLLGGVAGMVWGVYISLFAAGQD